MDVKTLILGHSYYAEENRKQLTEISKVLGSDLIVALPRLTGGDGLFRYSADDVPPGGPGYRFLLLDSWPSDDHLRGLLIGLRSCLDRIGPEVVHCEWAPQTVPALQLAMMKRLDLVSFALSGTLRQPVANFTERWYGDPLSVLTRWLLGEFDGLQSCTALAEKGFFGALDIEESRRPPTYLVYQTGVDTQVFRPPDASERAKARKTLGFGDDEVVVGYCGRFVEQKGLLDLVEALVRVKRHSSFAPNLRIALLGTGPLEEETRRRAKDYGLSVSFFPVRPHEEVARFMWALDIFSLPSQEREDWVEHDAHAVVEAMACGIPVVATSSGATKEVLADAGCLVSPGQPDALADGIRSMVTDEELTLKFASKGRKRASKCFSHQAVAEKLVAGWQSLLSSHG